MKKSNLAVICNPTTLIRNDDGSYSSPAWKINIKNIGNLIGNTFSLHESKKSLSYKQGTMTGFQKRQDGRVIITFEPDYSYTVDGSTLSWGQEKAYF